MPVALERKLKRQVADKKMSKERKDAYVYGTLRKTGWKPEREKKKELSAKLDKLIKFGISEEASALERLTKMRKAGGPFMRTPGKGGVPRGYSSMEAYTRTPPDWDPSFKNKPFVGESKRRYDPSQSHVSWLSSAEKPIEFDASILGPWQGPSGHTSKIDQLEFPAGLSPAAALRFPLPILMRYLNQRNLLQQQFSWKHDRLIRLSAKLDEIHVSTHPTK